MSRKKNMAVMMAGAMVATTAIPAFAAQASDQKQTTFTVDANNQAQLVAKVGELLNTEYTSVLDTKTSAPIAATANDKVYEIKVGSGAAVTNKTDFKNQLATALKNNTLAVVTVKDNGHETVGDAVNNYTTAKYNLSTLAGVEAATNGKTIVESVVEKGNNVVVTLTNKTVITLGVGSDELNFAKPVDKDGKALAVDESGNLTNAADADKVAGFAKNYVAINSETYTVNVTSTKMEETTVDKLYDGVFLTAEGQALMNSATSGNTLHAYENKTTDGTLESLDVVLANSTSGAQVQNLANGQISRITVTGDAAKLKGLEAIINKTATDTPVKIAGDDRYETAAMVSKDLRAGTTKDNIVIASAESLVDGLAAGPLAAQLNTSILLANKNEAPKATMDELKAALNIENTPVGQLKTKTVYIVGGDAVVGQSVVDQLENLGVTVERLAGDNRNETSIAVAKEMAKLSGKANTEGFVVGAEGIADAMSISSYAAQTKNPIIVSGFNSEVNADTLALTKGMNLTIVGGDGVVSNELQAQLEENNGKANTVDRVKGNDRFQTNAAVINKFFNDSDSSNDASKVFVAADGYKAGNDKLVDALTAAPLAAQSKAPIVLATEELDKDQVEALQLVDTTANANVVQVGGGVLSSVIAKVMSILG